MHLKIPSAKLAAILPGLNVLRVMQNIGKLHRLSNKSIAVQPPKICGKFVCILLDGKMFLYNINYPL